MIHRFPEEFIYEDPRNFTDPFRYVPHTAVIEAARLVMRRIESDRALDTEFKQGKMLGVLVVRDTDSSIGYVAAFSGNVGGRSIIEGFVPPIYDLTDPEGTFKIKEAEISSINTQISQLQSSEELNYLKSELIDAEHNREIEIQSMRERMAVSKQERESIRHSCPEPSVLVDLTKKSQFEKAELRRLKLSWEQKIADIRFRIEKLIGKIESLKRKRASMSESLQDWIFRQYIVHTSSGEFSSIAEIFSCQGMTAPGGTGECAAPKLLEFAYRNSLEPIAMGEFWYGSSPETAVRTHGHFYPSCTSKCGPLLSYMLKGVKLESIDNQAVQVPIITFEDDVIIIAEKPSGMPSVAGLDGRESLHEWLRRHSEYHAHPIESVHRLDMDTSGVMIFAKTPEAANNLRRQFEDHTIQKTYIARLSPIEDRSVISQSCISGSIELPLSADYDERPRQKVDFQHGKEAYTKFEIVAEYPNGESDIVLYPHTGRTHQLRVHCAHTLGLGRPILGDRLYGSSSIDYNTGGRLHLHALSITFEHPISKKTLTFSSRELCYQINCQ